MRLPGPLPLVAESQLICLLARRIELLIASSEEKAARRELDLVIRRLTASPTNHVILPRHLDAAAWLLDRHHDFLAREGRLEESAACKHLSGQFRSLWQEQPNANRNSPAFG